MHESSLERLFDRFRRRRDVGALGVVFDRTAEDLFRLALYLAPDSNEAEDLLQTTYLTAIESAEHHDPERPVLPWLMGILANHARRARRVRRRAPVPDRLLAPDASTDPLAAAAESETRSSLGNAIEGLPQPYRQVLALHLEHDLNAKEIGRVLERPAGTVRSQVVRGLTLLRRALPAGLATAAAGMLTPGHALAGVRDEVLRAARCLPAAATVASPTTAGPTTFVGLATGGLAIAALVFATLVVDSGDHPDAPNPTVTRKAEARAATPIATNPSIVDASRRSTGSVDAPLPTLARNGDRVVSLTWPDGTPAAGRELLVVGQRIDGTILHATQLDAEARFGTLVSSANGRVVVPREAFDAAATSPLPALFERGSGHRLPLTPGVTTWTLPTAHRVRGRCVDEDGEPLRGAVVWASPTGARFDVGGVVARADARSGRFDAMLCGIDSRHELWCTAAGHAPSPVARVTASTDEIVLRTSRRRGAVSGRVHGVDGRPIEGAVVALVADGRRDRDGHPSPTGSRQLAPRYVRTDRNGDFAFGDVAIGRASIVVRCRPHATSRRTIDVRCDRTADASIRVDSGAVLRGRIVGADGRPRVGVGVLAEVSPSSWSLPDHLLRTLATFTDTQGRYELGSLPLGENVRVRVTDEARLGWWAERVFRFAAGTRTWDPPAERAVEPPAKFVTGRVVDAAGNGVGARLVTLSPPSTGAGGATAFARLRRRAVRTATDGTFRIRRLPAHDTEPARLAVHAASITDLARASAWTAVATCTVAPRGLGPWRLTVPERHTEGVVHVRVDAPEPSAWQVVVRRADGSSADRVLDVDATGAVIVDGLLVTMQHRLGLRARDPDRPFVHWRAGPTHEVRTTAATPLRLAPSPTRTVHLEFVDDGEHWPTAGVRVDLHAGDAPRERLRRFNLRGPGTHALELPPATYELRVWSDRDEPATGPPVRIVAFVVGTPSRHGTPEKVRVRATTPGRSVALRFPFDALGMTFDRPGPLAVVVRDATGRRWFDGLATRFDADGAFRLDLLLPPPTDRGDRSYEVVAVSAWNAAGTAAFSIPRSVGSAAPIPVACPLDVGR